MTNLLLGPEKASNKVCSRVVLAHRRGGLVANPSPSSGNWKSMEIKTSLVGLPGKLVKWDFVI